jgi:hypothetical protein
MFDNFSVRNEIVFYRHMNKNGLGYVRSSLGRCMEDFFAERVKKDKDMYWAFREMNNGKGATRQNCDKALSS